MPKDSKLINTSDEQLIAATLQGEVASFGILVERYWNMVIALTLNKINDPIEAEDIAQESFMQAYSQLHKLRNPSRFAGWLSKIALQQNINSLRRNIRHEAVGYNRVALETLELTLAQNIEPGLNDIQVSYIRQAISQLPDKFQKLIIMRFVSGLSSREIAKQMGKRSGTIRVWLHRAYEILRKELSPLLKEVK